MMETRVKQRKLRQETHQKVKVEVDEKPEVMGKTRFGSWLMKDSKVTLEFLSKLCQSQYPG